MSQTHPAPPATIVIFGATGDLAQRLLAPALLNLERAGLLDPKTAILGVGHGKEDDEGLRQHLASFVEEGPEWDAFKARITYLRGDFTDDGLYEQLKGRLSGNAVFYLATAPSFFAPVIESLGKAGLFDESDGFRRVVVEKPFGSDLASAQELNRRILAQAHESQIYRIDHFLGKETVQNIIVARFGNPLIEAVWNNRYVDHVQITAAETVAVGSRGKFYDQTGALRDMVPNHLFQLLALVGMEPPNSLEADALRAEKSKVIAAVVPIQPEDAVRGQYHAGEAGGEAVPPYRKTAEVAPHSRTETYVAMKVAVETWRWHGVPFYLRTGKALTARDTEIVIHFRHAPLMLFRDSGGETLPPNRMILQIQPNEAIRLEIAVKQPGPAIDTASACMDFEYGRHFELGHRTGYETLLFDVLIGDQSLFQSAAQIEGGWRAVQPLLDAWASGEPDGYEAGSAGPQAANALLARDGRAWHAIA